MMLNLGSLGAITVEEFAGSVAASLQARGFSTRLESNVEPQRLSTPNVRVWMRMAGYPELSTDLTQSGQPWVIYSADNIAGMQADRYRLMFSVEEAPPGYVLPVPERRAAVPAGGEEGRYVGTEAPRYTASLSFHNTTTGNTSLLRVGDSWTLEVSGPPNSDVLSVGGPAGQRNRTVLGRTNSSGVWSTSGRMTSAEIGTWIQDFSVGGVPAGHLVFTVEAVPAPAPPPQKTVPEKLADQAEEEAAVPSWMESLTSNPLLLVGGAALVLFLVMGRGK